MRTLQFNYDKLCEVGSVLQTFKKPTNAGKHPGSGKFSYMGMILDQCGQPTLRKVAGEYKQAWTIEQVSAQIHPFTTTLSNGYTVNTDLATKIMCLPHAKRHRKVNEARLRKLLYSFFELEFITPPPPAFNRPVLSRADPDIELPPLPGVVSKHHHTYPDPTIFPNKLQQEPPPIMDLSSPPEDDLPFDIPDELPPGVEHQGGWPPRKNRGEGDGDD